jgi:4-hydroxybenzoate polyprenyltransferase
MHHVNDGIFGRYFRLLRVPSWVGWVFTFALGSILFEMPPLPRFAVFVIPFVLTTAGVFVVNQYFDRDDDKLNTYKRVLPVSSGGILPQTAVLVSCFFFILSICLVLWVDVTVVPLYLCALGLGICYSAPPFRLKSRPIVDVIVAGFGSGVLPFLMGLQVSNQLTLNFSLPWVWRRYQDAFLCVLPLLFFNSATHIMQAAGDYEADLRGNVRTFVVKYGKKTSMNVVLLFLVLCALLPVLYGFLQLSLTDFLFWYLILFTFSIPGLVSIVYFLRNPSDDRINTLRHIFQKATPVILAILWIYVYSLRISLA